MDSFLLSLYVPLKEKFLWLGSVFFHFLYVHHHHPINPGDYLTSSNLLLVWLPPLNPAVTIIVPQSVQLSRQLV